MVSTRRFFIPALLAMAVLAGFGRVASAAITVTLDQVKANGSINATAAHGAFTGNDNDLLDLLNGAGNATFLDTNAPTSATFSSTGMFSTAADVAQGIGTALGPLTWVALGKSDETGPFVSNVPSTTGTLVLDSPISGNVVLSLKASNGYAVYAFKDLVNVTYFDFSTSAMGANPSGQNYALSHASLFQAPSNPIPEPASLAVWSVIGLTFGLGFNRNRRRNA